jgi:coenzyme F420-reducing hydrogenase gamma subunit
MRTPPKIAVWKFASCDGCQLSILDCEDELLILAENVTIANFPEASRHFIPGPYDISLVEGSITTPHDLERIQEIRKDSKILVTIGACATAGGIQALRNFADVKDFISAVYAKPEYITTLAKVIPIADAVKVDYELRGCPINKTHLLELFSAILNDRKPQITADAVCTECKKRGIPCRMVLHNEPCMGPITHAGCGAICPAYDRPCFGCYGPKENANTKALDKLWQEAGVGQDERTRLLRSYNSLAKQWLEVGET